MNVSRPFVLDMTALAIWRDSVRQKKIKERRTGSVLPKKSKERKTGNVLPKKSKERKTGSVLPQENKPDHYPKFYNYDLDVLWETVTKWHLYKHSR